MRMGHTISCGATARDRLDQALTARCCSSLREESQRFHFIETNEPFAREIELMLKQSDQFSCDQASHYTQKDYRRLSICRS
jgi:hypothetical protein